MPNPFDEDYDPMEDRTYLMRAQLDTLRDIRSVAYWLGAFGGAAFGYSVALLLAVHLPWPWT